MLRISKYSLKILKMMTEIEKKQINNPNHIAIIMDGNRRWAEKHNLPSFEGHRRGAATAKNIIENAVELQIKYFTLFAFSSENWLRPKDEVTDLMKLIEFYLKNNKDLLKKKQIKFFYCIPLPLHFPLPLPLPTPTLLPLV